MITPIILSYYDFKSIYGKAAYFNLKPYPICIVKRFLDESGAICAYMDHSDGVMAKYKGEEAYAFERSFTEKMSQLMNQRHSKMKVWGFTAVFVTIAILLM
jgi:hypothetical protein